MRLPRMLSWVAPIAVGFASACSTSKALPPTGGPHDSGTGGASNDSSVDRGGDAPNEAGVRSRGQPDGSAPKYDASAARSAGTGPDVESGTAPPSCRVAGAGVSTCGTRKESCCTSLVVPGGTFYRTYDSATPDGGSMLSDDGGPTGEADPATVSSFRLDKYLITVGRFRAYVDYLAAGGSLPADGSGKHGHLNGGRGLVGGVSSFPLGSPATESPGLYEHGWQVAWNTNTGIASTRTGWDANLTTSCGGSSQATWTPSAGGQENLPINCITWYEAYAFCIWDGGFLPSEAEWEFAAAGGSEERQYPWGPTDPGASSRNAIYECYYPSGSGLCTEVAGQLPGVLGNLAPVGSATLGVGRWGHFDLAGEVREMLLDGSYFNPYVNPCTDCVYLGPEGVPPAGTQFLYPDHVARGGAFNLPKSFLMASHRDAGSGPSSEYGARCARSPE